MGPEAGAKGGQVIAEGTIADIAKNKDSHIGAFLKPECMKRLRPVIMEDCLFEHGAVSLATGAIHTVKPLEVKIPKGRLTVVTGVSGSGKTTLILESLVPGMEAAIAKAPLPSHVLSVDPAGISQVKLIDATPIEMCIRDRYKGFLLFCFSKSLVYTVLIRLIIKVIFRNIIPAV